MAIDYPLAPHSATVVDQLNGNGVHLYKLGSTAVANAISNILYTNDFIDVFNNSKYNPLDAILYCHCLPFDEGAFGSVDNFRANGHSWTLSFSIGKMTTQFSVKDCGTVSIPRINNNFSDFQSVVSVHLPFCSDVEVPAYMCVGGSIGVRYTCDLLTGDCIAHVKATDKDGNAQAIFSSTGNCAVDCPIVSTIDRTKIALAQSAVNSVGSIAGTVASFATGNVAGGVVGAVSNVANGISNTYDALQTPVTTRSTSVKGNTGAMGYLTPYVTVTTPRTVQPVDYDKLEGIPSRRKLKVSEMGQFVKAYSVEVGTLVSRANSNIVATAEEVQMIENMLKSGVYAE